MTLEEISNKNMNQARKIIKKIRLQEIWRERGCEIHLVGSLRTGLMMNKLDMDFHIYSESFKISDSFSAMGALAENPRIIKITYMNLLDTDERCLEWHAWYLDENQKEWQIDLIHILKESPYAGEFEEVADGIKKTLTDETRKAILKIKDRLQPNKNIMSIEIYKAVIKDGIRNPKEFLQWKKNNPEQGIILWKP